MSREDLVGLMGRADPKKTSKKAEPVPAQPDKEPLPSEASRFWEGEPLPHDLFGEVTIPSIPAALPKRLGNFPFWRGEARFLDAMEAIYRDASPIGLKVFLGEPVS